MKYTVTVYLKGTEPEEIQCIEIDGNETLLLLLLNEEGSEVIAYNFKNVIKYHVKEN